MQGMAKSSSFRLPESVCGHLAEIAERQGMTLTQALIVAIDRMYREVCGGK